jgi:hypothetical protein
MWRSEREREREGGAESYRKCVMKNFKICVFRRTGLTNTGRSDVAAYVACIGGMKSAYKFWSGNMTRRNQLEDQK